MRTVEASHVPVLTTLDSSRAAALCAIRRISKAVNGSWVAILGTG
jgi:hypothetical protein